MSDSPPPAHNKPPPPHARISRPVEHAVSMTEHQKQELTVQALGLLNEQVQARIVHYKAELQTSPELDAITAQVVQQLKAMQAVLGREAVPRASPGEIEALQVRTLSSLLLRLFNGESHFTSRVLKPVGRRVAKLFFESELHEKTRGNKEKVIFHAEQGVYYVLSRYKNRLRAELEGFEYASDDVRELTSDLLSKIERDLQVGFLSRRSPELNRVMTIYAAVLAEFLQHHVPPRVEQMSRLTVRAARTASRSDSVAHKLPGSVFADFRAAWERLFMQQMVFFCGDALLDRLESDAGEFRDETVRFFTDPHVFSETCQVLCEELYDFLCLEGFLDLPLDWRVTFERAE